VLVLVLRLVPVGEALHLEASTWNIFLFFLGMMAVAALADQSGVIDLVAHSAARLARGRVALLYGAVFLVGAVISLLFANDSAALVLTPIVYALVVRLALDPLPFVFATTFIADTASVGLPVSNPLNVIVADSFHLDLGSYVSHLWLSAVVAVLINVSAFFVIFRHSLAGRFEYPPYPEPGRGIASAVLILIVIAVAYLIASAFLFPLGIMALAGAAVLASNLWRLGRLDVARLGREISWPIFAFIAGMQLVVRGLSDAGVTAALGRVLADAAGTSHLSAITATAVGTAVGSNLINNLPMALVMTTTIPPLHVSHATRLDLIYSTILGCDLGPNLTHLGSLATFIWLFFLRRQGIDVSTWDYFRIGVVVTPLMLLGAILGLWLTSTG
jgi:arsenical pump membrane protein